MKLSKLLLVSSVLSLVVSANILPVVAKPSLDLRQIIEVSAINQDPTLISVRSALYTQVREFNTLTTKIDLSKSYNRSFSSSLVFNKSVDSLDDELNSFQSCSSAQNNFFETTMLFNDRLQQFLSIFDSSDDVDLIKNNENHNYATK